MNTQLRRRKFQTHTAGRVLLAIPLELVVQLLFRAARDGPIHASYVSDPE